MSELSAVRRRTSSRWIYRERFSGALEYAATGMEGTHFQMVLGLGCPRIRSRVGSRMRLLRIHQQHPS